MQRALVLCFLVLLLPLAAMADPQTAPAAPSQIAAAAAPAAPVCLDEILSPSSPDQGLTPKPAWRSVCCETDADCAAVLHCISTRHPACGGANTGCGRCNCVNN
ncbi:MAG TPA: hypothetical protein VF173_31245 [Thermoanaerobaculia bacterium]|nr:hypothetical protein [Thermoanaerobaculia bacterium]